MIEWPEELVMSIARRRAVIFLGAGVSMNSRNEGGKSPPSWYQFLQQGIQRCDSGKKEMQRLLKIGDYLSCCQMIKDKLDMDWTSLLTSTFVDPRFKHAKIHEEILKLDASIVVTPNFDKIYDNYANQKIGPDLLIKRYNDVDLVRAIRGSRSQRLILKIHGCIDTPSQMIFTRKEYADLRNRFSSLNRVMDALVTTHTFLFLGCGFSDPDILLLLEQYSRSFADSPPHYLAYSERMSSEYKSMVQSNYNIKILKYSNSEGHKELTDGLSTLGAQVDEARVALSEANSW